VRTLVFDVTPLPKSAKGRFVGRSGSEDQDPHRPFNGAYGAAREPTIISISIAGRVNSGPNLWLPAFIYSEESEPELRCAEAASFFQGADALWDITRALRAGAELSKILIESQTPVKDQSTTNNDFSPIWRNGTGPASRG